MAFPSGPPEEPCDTIIMFLTRPRPLVHWGTQKEFGSIDFKEKLDSTSISRRKWVSALEWFQSNFTNQQSICSWGKTSASFWRWCLLSALVHFLKCFVTETFISFKHGCNSGSEDEQNLFGNRSGSLRKSLGVISKDKMRHNNRFKASSWRPLVPSCGLKILQPRLWFLRPDLDPVKLKVWCWLIVCQAYACVCN